MQQLGGDPLQVPGQRSQPPRAASCCSAPRLLQASYQKKGCLQLTCWLHAVHPLPRRRRPRCARQAWPHLPAGGQGAVDSWKVCGEESAGAPPRRRHARAPAAVAVGGGAAGRPQGRRVHGQRQQQHAAARSSTQQHQDLYRLRMLATEAAAPQSPSCAPPPCCENSRSPPPHPPPPPPTPLAPLQPTTPLPAAPTSTTPTLELLLPSWCGKPTCRRAGRQTSRSAPPTWATPACCTRPPGWVLRLLGGAAGRVGARLGGGPWGSFGRLPGMRLPCPPAAQRGPAGSLCHTIQRLFASLYHASPSPALPPCPGSLAPALPLPLPVTADRGAAGD